jgi:hypothetical protein
VAVGVNYFVVVEDVVGCYQVLNLCLSAEFLKFKKAGTFGPL